MTKTQADGRVTELMDKTSIEQEIIAENVKNTTKLNHHTPLQLSHLLWYWTLQRRTSNTWYSQWDLSDPTKCDRSNKGLSSDNVKLRVVAAVTAGQKVLYLVWLLCAIVGLLGASGCCLVVFDHPLTTGDMCTGMACPDKRQTFLHIRPRNPITPLWWSNLHKTAWITVLTVSHQPTSSQTSCKVKIT